MGMYGKHAVMNYRGSLADGTVFDDHTDTDPIDFVVGNAEVFPLLEQAVAELSIGEETTVVIPCEHAYGPYREEAVRQTPLYSLSDWEKIEKGMYLEVNSFRAGSKARVYVKDLVGSNVWLDYNHPLAGQDLTYWVKLVDIYD